MLLQQQIRNCTSRRLPHTGATVSSLHTSLIAVVIHALVLSSLPSCSQKQQVVEESWPGGGPRRVCIYKGKGEKKELIRETFLYRNGQVEMTGAYKNGEREGYWISFYENGNRWSEGFYRNGKNDGKRLTYFENGRLRYEAHYRENERTGAWKFYDQAGNLIKTVDYSGKSQSPAEPVKPD